MVVIDPYGRKFRLLFLSKGEFVGRGTAHPGKPEFGAPVPAMH
jgi:hypothetical protein